MGQQNERGGAGTGGGVASRRQPHLCSCRDAAARCSMKAAAARCTVAASRSTSGAGCWLPGTGPHSAAALQSILRLLRHLNTVSLLVGHQEGPAKQERAVPAILVGTGSQSGCIYARWYRVVQGSARVQSMCSVKAPPAQIDHAAAGLLPPGHPASTCFPRA